MSNKTQLFIPSTIKVGYRSRSDTYKGKLAYIIYYDSKGKLRKEASWKSWCQEKLGSHEFKNKPHSGFTINKDVQRSREWFGSGRSMVRVYDDRGFEFEITCDNLMFVLMTTDCLRRELQGEFVYAWYGTELVLLPTGCEEYTASTGFTSLQAAKVSTKDLVEGCIYQTKRQDNLIYIGKLPYYKLKDIPKIGGSRSEMERVHIFVNANGNTDKNSFEKHSGLSALASRVSDIPVDNYPQLFKRYGESIYSNRPVALKATSRNVAGSRPNRLIKRISDGVFQEYSVSENYSYGRGGPRNEWGNWPTGIFELSRSEIISFSEQEGLEFLHNYTGRRDHDEEYNLTQLSTMDFVDLSITLERGETMSLNKYLKALRGY